MHGSKKGRHSCWVTSFSVYSIYLQVWQYILNLSSFVASHLHTSSLILFSQALGEIKHGNKIKNIVTNFISSKFQCLLWCSLTFLHNVKYICTHPLKCFVQVRSISSCLLFIATHYWHAYKIHINVINFSILLHYFYNFHLFLHLHDLTTTSISVVNRALVLIFCHFLKTQFYCFFANQYGYSKSKTPSSYLLRW